MRGKSYLKVERTSENSVPRIVEEIYTEEVSMPEKSKTQLTTKSRE